MTSHNNSFFVDKKKILKELTDKQLKNIPAERKLHFKDIRRISKYIKILYYRTFIYRKQNRKTNYYK